MIIVSDVVSFIRTKNMKQLGKLMKSAILFSVIDIVENHGTRNVKGKSERFLTKVVMFVTTFLIQAMVQCFSWNISLYILLRLLFKTDKSWSSTQFFKAPIGMYLTHVLHNYIITHRAEMIEPGYIKMWLTTLPGYQPNGMQTWLQEFSTEATQSSEFYKPSQVTEQRLHKLPGLMLQSLKRQFPFVLFLYSLPLLLKLKQVMKRSGMLADKVRQVLARTVRSSIVLMLLPYTLTEFPLIYGNWILPLFRRVEVDEEGRKIVRRNPVLHIGVASILSSLVFLQEPDGRLTMMVGYTIWRILEAFIRKGYLNVDKEKEQGKGTTLNNDRTWLLSPLFTALAAVCCLEHE